MSQTTTEFTSEVPSIANLTESERHELLMNERRRLALDILAERESAVALGDLAAAIAAREGGTDETATAVERIEVTLHHSHLPKMDELDVIDYDVDTNVVTP
jgi:hypothetical protein